MTNQRALLTQLLCLLMAGMSQAIHAAEPPAQAVEFFERRIRPILVTHCAECHSSDSKKREGGLLLDSRDGWMRGGDTGPAVIPGDPEKSLLILAVRQTDQDLRMPPKQKLSDAQIADLVAWVKNGAVDPRRADNVEDSGPRPAYGMSLEEGRRFWFRRSGTPPGPGRPSTISFWPGWKRPMSVRLPPRTRGRCCVESHST